MFIFFSFLYWLLPPPQKANLIFGEFAKHFIEEHLSCHHQTKSKTVLFVKNMEQVLYMKKSLFFSFPQIFIYIPASVISRESLSGVQTY